MSAVLPSAAERLAISREHLRRALHDAAAPRRPTDAVPGAPLALPWLERLRSIPGADIAIDAVGLWWSRHPARLAVSVASLSAEMIVRPIAQRHPLALVGAAFAVGAVLTWSRPWRWALKPTLLAGLLPQLLVSALKPAPHSQRPPQH